MTPKPPDKPKSIYRTPSNRSFLWEEKINDLTGKKFGNLTALGFTKTIKRSAYWKCLCDCGNTIIARANTLSNGHTKSCGCLKGIDTSNFEDCYVPVTESGCWIWIGSLNDNAGYGNYWVGRKRVLAHRASYEKEVSNVPQGMLVLHKCDIRCCVNPDHLYVGDSKQNTRDAVLRKRYPYGEKNPSAKLTEIEVIDIKKSDLSHSKIAKKYGIGETTVGYIRQGRIWKHVSET